MADSAIRQQYNSYVSGLENTLRQGQAGAIDPIAYQDALARAQRFTVPSIGGSGGHNSRQIQQAVSPQEIQATLSNLYSRYNAGTPTKATGGAVAPQAHVISGGGGGGGGGSAAPVVDPHELAAYDQAINNLQSGLNLSDKNLASGRTSIETNYKDALAQLLGAKTTAEHTYNENVDAGKKSYIAGKNAIGSNAGTQLTNLRRLLGARGAGGSSAYNVTAPGAVARQATLQRTDLGDTFAENSHALDNNWTAYLGDYNNQVSSTDKQRHDNLQDLESRIGTNRADLLQRLAEAHSNRAQAAGGNRVAAAQPFLDQANSLLGRLAGFTTGSINYKAPTYAAPNLEKYVVNKAAAPTVEGKSPSNDYTNPYLAALLGKKQQQGLAGLAA